MLTQKSLRIALGALAISTVATVLGSRQAMGSPIPLYEPPDGQAYFGFTYGARDSSDPLNGDTRAFADRYQDAVQIELAGKAPSQFVVPQNWQNADGTMVPFVAALTQIKQYTTLHPNSAPNLSWQSQTSGTKGTNNGISTATINTGSLDSYIHQYARDVRAFGKPIFIKPICHEFNGSWQHFCSPLANPSITRADFINAWRRVVDIFRQEGVTNVAWVWAVVSYPTNIVTYVDSNIASYYPGDDYVDWVGVDHYDYGDPNDLHSNPLTPQLYLDPVYSFAIAHAKPLMLPEFGVRHGSSVLSPAQQQTWLGLMFDYFEAHPKIKTILYFNFNFPYSSTVGHIFLYNNQVNYDPHPNVDSRLLAESGANFRNQFATRISNARYVSAITLPACIPNGSTLCLNNSRYKVQTQWITRDGASGAGQVIPLTADTGVFWFFSPNNVEMVIKVLNGCGVNARYWTFAGGLTDVNVILTVTDTQTGAVRIYTNPQGTPFQPIQDTDAFTTCP